MKKELDELKMYLNISKVDKMKATYHQHTQKWYLDKRNEAFTLIQEFGRKYEFSRQTLYSSFLYLDKILAYNNEIDQKSFELNILVCCLLSSKFIENDTFEINYNELTSISKQFNFTVEEIYNCEIEVIKKLNYFLGYPTIYEFIQYLNLIGVFYREEITNSKLISEDIQNITLKVMLSPISLKYPCEVIAMNIIRIVRTKYKLKEEYMKKILKKFQFDYDEIYDNCYDEINYLIFGEKKLEKKDKAKEKLLLFEDGDEKEKEEENNVEIQRRKNQAKTTKKLRGSIKFEVPKEYIKNIQIMKYSSSSNSSSSSSSLNSSSSSKKSSNENEEEKPNEKIQNPKINSNLKKGIINNKNNNKDNSDNFQNNNHIHKKKVLVNFNESKNQLFINDKKHTSLKLSNNNAGHKEKQRKIKPVNQDKINFPFTKRIKRMTSFIPENNTEKDVEIDIEKKNIEEIQKAKTLKEYKTPKFDYEIDYE
jgi:hypothetical protein